MKDKLTDIMRIGKVSKINPEKCTAEVTFEDRGAIVSRELFIVVPFTLKDQDYYMPAVDERVVCMFDPGAPSVGYIIGSFYADTRQPPIKNENKTYVKFEDETLIEYDKERHTITINVPASGQKSIDVVTASDITVKSEGNVRVESAKEIEIKCAADMIITTDAKLNVTASGDISMKSSANVSISSAAGMSLTAAGAMTLKGKTVDINP